MTNRDTPETAVISGTFEIKTNPANGAEKLRQLLGAVEHIGGISVNASLDITWGEQDAPEEQAPATTAAEGRSGEVIEAAEAERRLYAKTDIGLADLIREGSGINVAHSSALLRQDLLVRDVLVLGREQIEQINGVGFVTMSGLKGLLESYIPEVVWRHRPGIKDIARLCPELNDVHHAAVSEMSPYGDKPLKSGSVQDVLSNPSEYIRESMPEAHIQEATEDLVSRAERFSQRFVDARQRLAEE